MRYLSLEPVRREFRHFRARMSPLGVILAYHRINEGLADPQRLMVKPDYFAEQMEVLREQTQPVPLSELLSELKNRKPGERPLSAVTFDDGYRDNLQVALPILRRLGIPATFFIVTNAITRSHEYWWDELERLFLQPGRPGFLCIRLGDKEYDWRFESDCVDSCRSWDVCTAPQLVAQEAYLQIAAYLRTCPFIEREMILDTLHRWAGVERRLRDEFKTLTGNEIRQMDADDLACIGLHTVSHANLAAQDTTTQWVEVGTSQTRMHELLGKPVRGFAYPYGRVQDYNRKSVQILRQNGFQYACTTVPRMVHRWSHPLQLPRFTVGNWPGHVFEEKLSEFMQGAV